MAKAKPDWQYMAMRALQYFLLVALVPFVSGLLACDPPEDSGDDDDNAADDDDDDDADDDDDDHANDDDDAGDDDDPEPDCSNLQPTEGEVAVGSVLENFRLEDQDGNTQVLYDYCDKTIVLFQTAAW